MLKESYQNEKSIKKICPDLLNDFQTWLENYWKKQRNPINQNKAIFHIEDQQDYIKAILYYISGMTDNYAINMYHKIIQF